MTVYEKLIEDLISAATHVSASADNEMELGGAIAELDECLSRLDREDQLDRAPEQVDHE